MTRELTASVGRQNISIRDGAAALFRRKGLVLLTFLTVIVGTVIVTLVLPDKYESRMKILVKNQRVDVAITAANSTQPGAMTDGEVSETQINSEIELLTSRDLLTQIVKECGLANATHGWLSRTPPPETIRVETAVNQLSRDLVVTPARKANIISISYASNSPEVSAEGAEAPRRALSRKAFEAASP